VTVTHKKVTHISGYTTKDGVQRGGYTQRRQAASPDEAKEQARTRKYQAASAALSAGVALFMFLEFGFTLLTVLIMIVLVGLNMLLAALLQRRSPARRTVRRVSRHATSRARKQTARARGRVAGPSGSMRSKARR
jgi:Flp pilus assembly protein TadB